MSTYTIKELIKDLPDDMIIGGSGYLCEYLECYSISTRKVTKSRRDKNSIEILYISIEHAGDEPD